MFEKVVDKHLFWEYNKLTSRTIVRQKGRQRCSTGTHAEESGTRAAGTAIHMSAGIRPKENIYCLHQQWSPE